MYPSIVTSNTSTEETATTSHTIDLPTGITSGDLLLAFVKFSDGSGPGASTPSGWTKISITGNGYIYRRVADGSEGSTITVTTTANHRSSHITLRIEGFNTTTPLYIADTSTQNAANYNNPPSLATGQPEATPFLWIAGTGAWGTTTSVTPSANYGSTLLSSNTYTSGSTDDYSCIALATRELQAATEDPSAFANVPQKSHYSFTLAINPEPQSATGNNTFTEHDPVFFSNSTTTGATGTNDLHLVDVEDFGASGIGRGKTVWSNETKPSTTWTNDTI